MWLARCPTSNENRVICAALMKAATCGGFTSSVWSLHCLVRSLSFAIGAGTYGQVKFETFEPGEDAETMLNRIERGKRRRGYVDCRGVDKKIGLDAKDYGVDSATR